MKCSKCGNEVISGALFCDNCGNKMTTEIISNVCPKCGEAYEEGSIFCGNCGNKLSSEVIVETESECTPQKVCPSCKTQWDDDVAFCGNCGTPFLKSSADSLDAEDMPEDTSAITGTEDMAEDISAITDTEDMPEDISAITDTATGKIKCENCGCDLDSDALFCGNCGTKVNGESVHSVPDSSTITHSIKSTMRKTTKETDPNKIADSKIGKGFFSKAGDLD